MNPFFRMNPMFQMIQQINAIKQNPSQLATLLKQRGMISDDQVQTIQQMGGNYEQIGRYLMSNGRLPSNVQQYESQVNQVQDMMNQQ